MNVEDIEINVFAIIGENWCLNVRSVDALAVISFCGFSLEHSFILGSCHAKRVKDIELIKPMKSGSFEANTKYRVSIISFVVEIFYCNQLYIIIFGIMRGEQSCKVNGD